MQEITGRLMASAVRVLAFFIFCAGPAQAATITVNSVDDDVFPDILGGAGVQTKCTLRMAIAAANLDVAVGGGTGCAAGSGSDTIVFDAALFVVPPRTITLASVAMFEAPAVYTSANTAALVVSRPLAITGPGSALLTIDGSVAGNDGRRPLIVSDGVSDTDFQFTMTGVRFYRGRTIDLSAGCMFSRESLTLDDVVFENCESVGGATNSGFGGALGAGTPLSPPAAVAPTIIITNSKFLGNRAVRGTAPYTGIGTDNRRPDNGAAFFGSGANKVGAVTLTNVLFNGNSAERHGAMLIQNAASVLISGSHFIGNSATGTLVGTGSSANNSGRYGGFLINTVSGNVTINNKTRVNGNVANEERGGFGVSTVAGTVTINEVDISGNYVNRGRIGGFEVLTNTFDGNGDCTGSNMGPVNISNVRIQGNSVATNAGGFRVICSGALTMTDVEVIGNETRGYRASTTDTVANPGTGNSAGILAQANEATASQSTATLNRVLIQGNETGAMVPSGSGGGGFNVLSVNGLGAFTADAIRVIDNFAEAGNAGLTLTARGATRDYLVVNSEFAGNRSPGVGALFMETDGRYTLRNSTVSGNLAEAGGGGIVKVNANTNTVNGISVAVEHSTIARNSGNFEEAFGAGVWANQPHPAVGTNTLFNGNNAAITFKNSILGTRSPGYTGSSTVFFDAAQGVTNVTATNTLLEWTGGAPANFCSGVGMKCNVGSLVSPLANNGGADRIRTMALLAGSPAINAGGAVLGSLTTDQRGAGFPRVVGPAVDIGAYEAEPTTTYGCTLDVDGNGGRDALTDGLLIIRALFGLTGTAVTTGAIGTSPTRGNWGAIQSYLNANCGTGFAP